MSSHSSPAVPEEKPDLDLPLYDTLSHSHYYYNQNQSIIYSQGNALDLLYETTIDSTIRRKESLTASKAIPAEWTGELALNQQEPRESRGSRGSRELSELTEPREFIELDEPREPREVRESQDEEPRESGESREPGESRGDSQSISAGMEQSAEIRDSLQKTAELKDLEREITAGKEDSVAGTELLLIPQGDLSSETPVSSIPAGVNEAEPREISQRTTVYSTFRGKGEGFTQLQAVQFLLENSGIPETGLICRRDNDPRGRTGFFESASESSYAGANQIRASFQDDSVPRASHVAGAQLRVPGDQSVQPRGVRGQAELRVSGLRAEATDPDAAPADPAEGDHLPLLQRGLLPRRPSTAGEGGGAG